tara:strand:- start:299 stop:1849 length:1551 start_codon:yes stop_codon:yes gene_type:complete
MTDTGTDKAVWDKACAMVELSEYGARNLQWPFDHENPDSDCEGQYVYSTAQRMMSMLAFIVPTTTSSKWNPAFVNVLQSAHSARIEPVSNMQKEIVRQTGGRCQICGTKEHSCPWVIHLCGNKTRGTYNARKWKNVDEWPRLFDEFLPEYASVTKDGWRPPSNKVPDEYLGAYAVGKDCYRKLLLAFVGQNLVMEMIYSSWTFISKLAYDPGYKEAPSVTDERIQTLIKTIDDLQACAASDFPRVPELPYEPSYWKKIGDHINKLAKDDPLKALEIGGMRAREILKLGEQEEESLSSDEDDEEGAVPHTSRRRDERQQNDLHADRTRRRQPARASTSAPGVKRKNPSSDWTARSRRRSTPRRAAAAAGADRLHMRVIEEDEEDEGEMQEAIEASALEEAKRQSMCTTEPEQAGSSRDPLPCPPPTVPHHHHQQHVRGDQRPIAGASDGAGRLRSMMEAPNDSSSRLLRGYETTISEAIDLVGYLHRSGAANWAAVAGRIVVTLQDLVEKNQKLRSR